MSRFFSRIALRSASSRLFDMPEKITHSPEADTEVPLDTKPPYPAKNPIGSPALSEGIFMCLMFREAAVSSSRDSFSPRLKDKTVSGIAGIIAKERVAVRTVHFQRIEIGIAEIKFIQLHTQSLTQTIVEVIPAAGAAVFH